MSKWRKLWQLLMTPLGEILQYRERLEATQGYNKALSKHLDDERAHGEMLQGCLDYARKMLAYYEGAITAPGATFSWTCDGCGDCISRGICAPQMQIVDGVGKQLCAKCWVAMRKVAPDRQVRPPRRSYGT